LPAYDPPRPATQRVTAQTVLINLKPPDASSAANSHVGKRS
jgi:hypothetical protein